MVSKKVFQLSAREIDVTFPGFIWPPLHPGEEIPGWAFDGTIRKQTFLHNVTVYFIGHMEKLFVSIRTLFRPAK